MSVPSRPTERGGPPSDQLQPLLPTTFPLYERRFHDEPPIFYSDKMSPVKVAYIEFFWRQEFPGIYPALLNGQLFEKGKRNIGRHNIMAAMYGHDLAYLSGSRIQEVATAAGIHDSGKVVVENMLLDEIMQLRNSHESPEVTQAAVRKALKMSKIADRDRLKNLGYSHEIITLMGANVPTKPDIRIARSRSHPPSIDTVAETIAARMSPEEQIIWYVDAALLDTQLVEIPTRFLATRTIQEDSPRERRNDEVRKALTAIYGFDYHELQIKIGEFVQAAIAGRIRQQHKEFDYLTGDNLYIFLQSRLDQRVEDWGKNATPTPLLQAALS